ncbi:carboxymuconolactone decarboxylase family protein [Amycolatopsis balhimycina DSM 5908]|uniref:Carboxymuconolactone decarboxylase family protein n=1 Tax=Amycolatopsis balhimycina DSM 5908 TaxID=1081091 RepID=A0A428WNC2_AMYBA|nr:carboxymuconolactone decarboxylase family protein [Amycolatopsis balhimycina]RSM44591.1 carboxymuconolactone decarboxylase family protein [Amycolatopsis balhimycina DSM 5908]
MTSYRIHTAATATEAVREPLEVLQGAFGFVPAAAGLMANSAALLNTFFAAFGYFRGTGTFGPAERQVLLLSNAVANGSEWAVAFHSLEALADGVEPDVVEALRRGEAPGDERMAALSAFTRSLIAGRGHIGEAEVTAFEAAGFTGEQVFEVVTGIAISVMTNYTANVARPPLEDAVAPYAWTAGHSTGG